MLLSVLICFYGKKISVSEFLRSARSSFLLFPIKKENRQRLYNLLSIFILKLIYSSSSFSTTASIFHQAFLLLQLLYLPPLAIFQTMILLLPFFVPLFYVFRTILSTLSAKANPLFSFNKWYHIHRQIIYPILPFIVFCMNNIFFSDSAAKFLTKCIQ